MLCVLAIEKRNYLLISILIWIVFELLMGIVWQVVVFWLFHAQTIFCVVMEFVLHVAFFSPNLMQIFLVSILMMNFCRVNGNDVSPLNDDGYVGCVCENVSDFDFWIWRMMMMMNAIVSVLKLTSLIYVLPAIWYGFDYDYDYDFCFDLRIKTEVIINSYTRQSLNQFNNTYSCDHVGFVIGYGYGNEMNMIDYGFCFYQNQI